MSEFYSSINTKLVDYLYSQAEAMPEHDAVIYADSRFTYDKLSRMVCLCAKALLAHGIKKSDCIATLCTSRVEFWITFLAANQIGALWLGINPKYRLPEIRYIIEDAQPKLLFAMASFEGNDFSANIEALQRDYDCIEQMVALTDPLPDTHSFDDFLQQGSSINNAQLAEREASIDRFDPALLVYTSGSTGKPKGAVLSNYSLTYGCAVQNEQYQLDKPRFICNSPINHVGCVADTCCVVLQAGGTLVFQEKFDAGLVLDTIAREKITFFAGVPTMLLMLLEHPHFDSTDFSSMELILWGGAAMPVPLLKRLQTLGPRLMNAYGMTETAANTTHTGPDADLTELSETIGRPNPHMPCRIMNSDGQPCEVGEHGELQFKGDYLLLEYLNRPEATREVYTADGWLHTGDLGYWRDDGTISLVGRLSEMFKSGGYNVYPREIEDVLESHPAIEMAAVVSVPDDRYQEVGAAFYITSDDTVDKLELKSYCKARLANYKVPKYFSLVHELPLLPIGKVDKVHLRKLARADHVKESA